MLQDNILFRLTLLALALILRSSFLHSLTAHFDM
jgi:hypothetical protein